MYRCALPQKWPKQQRGRAVRERTRASQTQERSEECKIAGPARCTRDICVDTELHSSRHVNAGVKSEAEPKVKLRQTVVCLILAAAIGSIHAQPAQTPVILISIPTTLRAGHLSSLRLHEVHTPNIDSFASLPDAAKRRTWHALHAGGLPRFRSRCLRTRRCSHRPIRLRIRWRKMLSPLAPGAVTLASPTACSRLQGRRHLSPRRSWKNRWGWTWASTFYDSPFSSTMPFRQCPVPCLFMGATPGLALTPEEIVAMALW